MKRSFVDLKIANNEKLAEVWRQVSNFYWKPFLRSFFVASLRVRVAGSMKKIMLTTPMKYETFNHFKRCHQHFPNLSKSIDMGIPEGL